MRILKDRIIYDGRSGKEIIYKNSIIFSKSLEVILFGELPIIDKDKNVVGIIKEAHNYLDLERKCTFCTVDIELKDDDYELTPKYCVFASVDPDINLLTYVPKEGEIVIIKKVSLKSMVL